uniref:Uncharacterized protein n=1 Tax=Rhizophora mucronata TaxID=61149 RepID=A0A2P2ND87_RHIMU
MARRLQIQNQVTGIRQCQNLIMF